jgi:membrane associated rhomboid family serine protease
MLPLKDDNPTQRFPIVTVLLIVANIALFGYELSLGQALPGFVESAAFVPSRFFADPTSLAVWRSMLLSMFLHGGWLHIGGNMLYLWIFGNNVEDRMGRLRFLAFYLAAGVVATMAQSFVSPGSTVPQIGASGAVAGVLGSYLLLFPRAAVLTAIPIIFFIELARLPAALVIGFWFLLQLASGIAGLPTIGQNLGGVAFFAHVGGFVAGLLLTVPLALRRRRTYASSDRLW